MRWARVSLVAGLVVVLLAFLGAFGVMAGTYTQGTPQAAIAERATPGIMWGAVDKRVLALAKAHRVKVMPLFTNEGFNGPALRRLLSDSVALARSVKTMVDLCKANGFWGIQFDVENLNIADRDRFTGWYTDAANALHAAGFTLSEATVLTLARHQLVAPARPMPDGVSFTVLDLPRDGAAVVDKQVAVDSGRFEPTGYREFAQRQVARYAAMQAAGLGHWFGLVAQVDGRAVLVASCGLFRASARPGDAAARLGRFQYVSTHPAWRRRGLCTALVHAVCRHGFDAMGLDTLVMVADPADVAIGVYESLGYRRGTSTWQFERPPG